MTVSEILAELQSRGVTLQVEGDSLKCRGKQSALTPELLDIVRQHKGELLALLAPHACTCNPLLNQKDVGALAQAACGPGIAPCSACGYRWQCKVCRGCRQCRVGSWTIKKVND